MHPPSHFKSTLVGSATPQLETTSYLQLWHFPKTQRAGTTSY